jgi:formate-dependent nitrite reductase membrane component NrfD
MNLFVVDPQWGWWIIGYFFLGGIAAGAYFVATLIDLLGHEDDWEIAHMGYWIAFPLILLCGLFLIVDLEQPSRFWHMLFKSEVVAEALRQGWPLTGASWSTMAHAPMLKPWSPMSVGSWAILLFGVCSGLSFLGSVWPDVRWLGWLRRGVFSRILQIIGCLLGFFVAAYTGSLLTATNQPVWSDSVWIATLFLTSASSTGIAVLILMARWLGSVPEASLHRLERADLWALALELVVFVTFVASLGPFLETMLEVWPGKVLVVGTLVLGLLLPLGLHLRLGMADLRGTVAASACVLVGGFLLRYAIVTTPPELLSRGPTHLAGFSPEAGRPRGGGPGADPGNHPPDFQPRSKLFSGNNP